MSKAVMRLKARGKKYTVLHRKKLGKFRWRWIHVQQMFRTKQSAENWIGRKQRGSNPLAFPRVVKLPVQKHPRLKGGIALYDQLTNRWLSTEKKKPQQFKFKPSRR